MPTDKELLKGVVTALDEAYADFRAKSKKRKITDRDFAKWLGIPPTSLSGYINGVRLPDFANALRMSEKLGRGFVEMLGYGHIVITHDPKLKDIVMWWEEMDTEFINLVYDHFKEELEKKHARPKSFEPDIPDRSDRISNQGGNPNPAG